MSTAAPLPANAKRLWKAFGIMVLLIATFVGMNLSLSGEKHLGGGDLGHDFLAFYTAGTFVREGDFTTMYDMTAVHDFELGVARQFGLQLGPGFMPWWNPPFFALAVAPLTNLEYRSALAVWLGINVTCVALACWMLVGVLHTTGGSPASSFSEMHTGDPPVVRQTDWRIWALVPALLAVSVPFILTLTHGQNTGVSLLLLTGVVMLWRMKRAFLAGLVCGLMFYKPQLGALVAFALSIRLGRRALGGVVCTGVALLAVTLLAMPGSIEAFLTKMPANLTWFQETNQYYWERHVTIKALWRLLFQFHDPGVTKDVVIIPWAMCTIVLGTLLVLALVNRNGSGPRADPASFGVSSEDRAIGATIVCSPLLMPFYFDYDLLLMAIPVVLYATERLRTAGAPTTLDRWTTIGWATLAGYIFVNPHVADVTRINGTALVLAWCASLSVARALWRESSADTIELRFDEPLALKRAA
jgi:hypothetical protein